MRLDRTNVSVFGRWWWTVDRVLVAAIFILVCVGAIVVTAASPSVAHRLDLGTYYFAQRHYIFLLAGCATMFFVSLLSPTSIKRGAALGVLASFLLMILTLLIGPEVKGAQRWITLGGFTLQPSEFMKPCFVVMISWFISEHYKRMGFPGMKLSIGLFIIAITLLAMQPDFGMIIVLSATWGIQLFLAGLPLGWVVILGVLGIAGVITAYFSFSHVQRRIDMFLDPSSGDNYQVSKSLEALQNGGILGQGPGEGKVKHHLPDSHTDFVFAVIGEEFGMVVTIAVIMVFAFIVFRIFSQMWKEQDLFVVLAVAGLASLFALQTIVNMGVSVNLLPAKGMTLPFLSYGGSSVLSISLTLGVILALTRKRYGKVR